MVRWVVDDGCGGGGRDPGRQNRCETDSGGGAGTKHQVRKLGRDATCQTRRRSTSNRSPPPQEMKCMPRVNVEPGGDRATGMQAMHSRMSQSGQRTDGQGNPSMCSCSAQCDNELSQRLSFSSSDVLVRTASRQGNLLSSCVCRRHSQDATMRRTRRSATACSALSLTGAGENRTDNK